MKYTARSILLIQLMQLFIFTASLTQIILTSIAPPLPNHRNIAPVWIHIAAPELLSVCFLFCVTVHFMCGQRIQGRYTNEHELVERAISHKRQEKGLYLYQSPTLILTSSFGALFICTRRWSIWNHSIGGWTFMVEISKSF
jgi:hypothetical protein